MTDLAIQLGYIELETTRPDQWSVFAREVLGLTVTESVADGRTVQLFRSDRQAYRIAVVQGETDTFVRTVYRLGDSQALDAIADRLSTLGATFERADSFTLPSGRRGNECLDVVDPAGNNLRFTWGSPEQGLGPLASPLGISYSPHRLGTLGHVVLVVPDFQASLAFYRDGLGFSVTDFIGDGATQLAFLRCNERHHTVAIQEGEVPRVDHVMLEVADLDDVGIVYDRARRVPGVVVSEMGRHTNDLAVSFYLNTPLEGLEIEFATGGIDVFESRNIEWMERGSVWGHKRP